MRIQPHQFFKKCILLWGCWLLSACSLTPSFTVNGTPSAASGDSIRPSPASVAEPISYPVSCIKLSEPALPVANSILESHILYQGYDPETREYQLRVYTIRDNTFRQLSNYGWSSLGLGFLNDGYHFVLARGDVTATLGDLSDSVPTQVPVDKNLLENFQPHSGLWSTLAIRSKNPPAGASDYFNGMFYSPNGEKVATWSRGNSALTIIDEKTKEFVDVLKTEPADRILGTWTSNGQQFIFAYNQGTPDTYGTVLYSVNADGSDLMPITQIFARATIDDVVLSPDNSRLLFLISFSDQGVAGRSFGVFTFSSNELHIFQVGIPLGGTLDVAQSDIVWSPDSQWLAYIAHWDQIDIRVTNIETGNTYCVTDDNFIENLMDWR